MTLPCLDMRRRALLGATLGTLALAGSGLPRHAEAQTAGRNLRVTQLIDTSSDQQELSRDYSTGWQLALAELARAGRTTLQLQTIQTDGSADALRRALERVRDDRSQVALVGTVGERLASAAIVESRRMGLGIAHLAPWLAASHDDASEGVFPLFASREVQIEKAVQSLAQVGVKELGLVYPSPAAEQQFDPGIAAAARRLGLQTVRLTVPAGQDAAAFGAALKPNSPAVLLFVGGTVELALFSQGLSRRGLQRYVICLSDVDVTTLLQLGPGKSTPLILTQVVPNPQSSQLPVAMAYRAALKVFYDEPPSPVSLAGYIAGRYAAEALGKLEGEVSRATVMASLQKLSAFDIGGFKIKLGAGQRGSSFVNQLLLQGGGRLIG